MNSSSLSKRKRVITDSIVAIRSKTDKKNQSTSNKLNKFDNDYDENDNYDDIDDDDDNIEVDDIYEDGKKQNNNRIIGGNNNRRCSGSRNRHNHNLPGVSSSSNSTTTPLVTRNYLSRTGEVPKSIALNVRNFLDMLVSSVLLEAQYLTSLESKKVNSALAIPGVVYDILAYNNFVFQTIKYGFTKHNLPEPVWFSYDVKKAN